MDARQRRSRERLHAAVLELADTRAVDELSVTEVAAAAGVHRSTFYEHAASPVALLQQALVSELDTLRDELLADTTTDVEQAVTRTTRAVLDHVERHADIYRRGLGAGSGAASLHAMLSGHFLESSRRLGELARVDVRVPVPDVADDVVADAAIRFIADGTVGVIEGWLDAPEPKVDDFMRVYVSLLPAWWPKDLTAATP
ncbi:TetR/AcrR family transcriptional regulator [Aeromicrobium massiliense]|uniref:TetR/AcrR family transcriptional regulator n=1 Tax=Aeromicrobium massiliense TaxID=1464554 RepID=UPI0002EBE8E4|nr:TetR/AcrR family transcriptional regulator [Aeromicrobium massiliense]